MGIIARKPASYSDTIAEGSHTGTLAAVHDEGLKPNMFQKDENGQPKLRHQISLEWTLEDGARIREWQTLSLHDKANLTKVVKALTGRIPNEDFEVTALVGLKCRLEIEHRPGRDNKLWPRIAGHFAANTKTEDLPADLDE